jgi:antitoxin (DNA-binding transcriptional repressor) of toxin-antitoxin stability system
MVNPSDWSYILTRRCPMKEVGAAKFKEQCLALLDHLEPDGLVITKHGRPVARLIPWERESSELIGSMRDSIQVKGDLLTTGVPWDAES